MDNPFAKFQIDHLSPSSLNCYIEQPASWVMQYLYNMRDGGSPAMWRGSAVEAGLDVFLKTTPEKRNVEDCIPAAWVRYEMDAQGDLSDDVAKERANIEPILREACIALADRPIPDATQAKIEIWLDGIEVPIIGFIDFVWPDDCLDLKTTTRMPSEVSGNHARQVATYAKAKQRPCHLLYVTPKKHEFKPVVDIEPHLKYLAKQAMTIRNLLSAVETKEQAAKFFLPDYDHYRWNQEAAREAALNIWR